MTPSPIPIPLPVEFGPHEADWWMVGLTALGVFASFSVAFLAWRTSRQAVRIAEASHNAEVASRKRDERRGFAERVRTLVTGDNALALLTTSVLPTLDAFSIRAEAFVVGDGADKVIDWLQKGTTTVVQGTTPGVIGASGPRQLALRALGAHLEMLLAAWMLDPEDTEFDTFEIPK